MDALGFDIGGVFIQHVDKSGDTSFYGDNYLGTPEVEGVFEALAALRRRFGDQMYILSFCGRRTELRSRDWLGHHRLEQRTGITADRIHFVRSRKAKGPQAKLLGLTHFVDDKLEVLEYMTTVPQRFLFQPSAADAARHAQTGSSFPIVTDMPAVTRAILLS